MGIGEGVLSKIEQARNEQVVLIGYKKKSCYD